MAVKTEEYWKDLKHSVKRGFAAASGHIRATDSQRCDIMAGAVNAASTVLESNPELFLEEKMDDSMSVISEYARRESEKAKTWRKKWTDSSNPAVLELIADSAEGLVRESSRYRR